MVYLDFTARKTTHLPSPPGFQSTSTTAAKDKGRATQRNENELKLKRAWEVAFAPAKSLPMQAIMLYFSGSGVQIFSLGTIFMLLTGPISAVAGMLKAFEPLRTTNAQGELSYTLLLGPMLVFVICQAFTFGLGLYKCWTMGILPSGAADWLQFENRPDAPEWSDVRALIFGAQ